MGALWWSAVGSPVVLAIWLAASLVPASANDWNAARVPASGPAQAIGGYSGGCLQGAAALPARGPGDELPPPRRHPPYGHPGPLPFVQHLGAAARAKKLGLVLVGDLSQARGGPTPSGHRSHQTGLDVDVGYAAPPGLRAGAVSAADRERLRPPAVVDLQTHSATPAWTSNAALLLALAASDPTVDRIFVNPAIKRMLCEGPTGKAPWVARIRPWWGHHDHFHVRLKCPEGSPGCVAQAPPTDDGCGPALAWWFTPDALATLGKRKQADAQSGPRLPEACAAVLAQPA